MLALKLALPLIGLLLQLARRVTAVPGALRGRRRSFEALAVEAFGAAVAENELAVLAADITGLIQLHDLDPAGFVTGPLKREWVVEGNMCILTNANARKIDGRFTQKGIICSHVTWVQKMHGGARRCQLREQLVAQFPDQLTEP